MFSAPPPAGAIHGTAGDREEALTGNEPARSSGTQLFPRSRGWQRGVCVQIAESNSALHAGIEDTWIVHARGRGFSWATVQKAATVAPSRRAAAS